MAGLVVRYAEPATPAGERASAMGLSAALLTMAAEAWDGAAAHLIDENRALAGLLADSAAEDDFRLSALQAENRRLRAKLILDHIAAETAADSARQEAIWAELVASTERRKISSAPV
jgi:hypothetical protein